MIAGFQDAEEGALEQGILQMAEEQAGEVLKDLLSKVGYSAVVIEYSSSDG
jgi:hypothetical protein